MYSKYEIPYFSACLYYYDTEYSRETSTKVLEILEKYGMFPPQNIYADKLTENRYLVADTRTRDIFINAYTEQDVFQVEMVSDGSIHATEYWKVDWLFTFHKRSGRKGNTIFKPWNMLQIKSTHGRLNDAAIYEDYLQCIMELIMEIQPFYASIDDGGNWVRLMHKKRTFTPGQIQEVFWGNYWGRDYCAAFGLDVLVGMPAHRVQNLRDGVFFTLTDHISSFDSKTAKAVRKKVKRYLGIGKKGLLGWFA